jgi:molybdenum cofactor biosynthesis enzyme MoaA
MNPYYNLVADRANHRCEYCHAPELIFNFQSVFDVSLG